MCSASRLHRRPGVAVVTGCAPGHRVVGAGLLGGLPALVSHGGVLDCLYRHANAMTLTEPRQHELRNAPA